MTAPNAPPAIATPQPPARTGPGGGMIATPEGAPAATSSSANGVAAPSLDDAARAESPSDAARVLTKVRRLMLISSALTFTAIVVVLGLVGYRLFGRGEYHQTDLALTLPKGTKILQTAVAEDRIVVTLDAGGAIEIRTYDLHTLKPMGRLSFGSTP